MAVSNSSKNSRIFSDVKQLSDTLTHELLEEMCHNAPDTSWNDGGFLETLLAFPMSDEMRAKEKFRKEEREQNGMGKKGQRRGRKQED